MFLIWVEALFTSENSFWYFLGLLVSLFILYKRIQHRRKTLLEALNKIQLKPGQKVKFNLSLLSDSVEIERK